MNDRPLTQLSKPKQTILKAKQLNDSGIKIDIMSNLVLDKGAENNVHYY